MMLLRFILLVLFVFVLCPSSFILRLLGFDPMQSRKSEDRDSYWKAPKGDQSFLNE